MNDDSSLIALSGCLKVLHLEGSHVLNPEPLSYLEQLTILNLKDNYLGDYESVQYFVKSLREITNLDMRGNPITKVPKFHESIIVLLPKL